jgi:Ase1/PRC1/MAP65 family protein
LEALKEQRAPTLELIDKHRSLVKDRDDLAASSQDASRLMLRGQKGEKRDPTRLLREEKMRKRIAKELPKVEIELKKVLEKWENEYGRPFLVHGERYLDELAAAAAKAAPPRSKTPSGPPPRAKTPAQPIQNSNKIVKPATVANNRNDKGATKAPPPPRSGARTPTGTVRRIPHTTALQLTGQVSPSRIPARAPLGNMQNSPERRGAPEIKNGRETIRKGMLPPKAPPPKMRDLFIPPPAPTPGNHHYANGQRVVSAASSNGSVRHVTPEDVYDDRETGLQMYSSIRSKPGDYRQEVSQQSTPQTYHDLHSSGSYPNSAQYLQAYYPSQPVEARRQVSATSSITNTVSGSENWETYDDASEPEADASEAYYAKLRAARGKRFTPDSGYAAPLGGAGKRLKGIRALGAGTETLMEGKGGQLVKVSGSEAGWTDEDAF